MRVGLDIDGVQDPGFVTGLAFYLVEHCGWDPEDCPTETNGQWDFWTAWNLDQDGYEQACHDAADAGVLFQHGDPYPGVQEAYALLRFHGHTLHLVTNRFFGSRAQVSHEATEGWLRRHGLVYDSLTFSADKTIIPVDVFVEDNLGNYDALEAQGVRCYLVDQPWNRDSEESRRRVPSLLAAAQEIVALGKLAAAGR